MRVPRILWFSEVLDNYTLITLCQKPEDLIIAYFIPRGYLLSEPVSGEFKQPGRGWGWGRGREFLYKAERFIVFLAELYIQVALSKCQIFLFPFLFTGLLQQKSRKYFFSVWFYIV